MNDLTLQERLQAAEAPAPAGIDTLDIVEYWRAIAKRRWSILGLTLLVAVLAGLIASSMRPLYRGTATILIEQGKSKIVSIEEVYSQGLIQREYYQTQVEILKSEELARKVVRKLGLASHPDFDPRQNPAPWYRRLFGFESPAANAQQAEDAAVVKLREGLQIQLVRNSQLAQISFSTYDKNLSAAVPNAMADMYIESDLE